MDESNSTPGKVTGFHTTTVQGADAILKNGFRPTRHEGGGFFGPGIYLTPTLHDARTYGHGKPGRVTLVVTAAPSRMFTGRGFGEALDATDRVGDYGKLSDQCGHTSGDALGILARKAGFDALYLTHPEPDDGGPQIVLFNLRDIQSVSNI